MELPDTMTTDSINSDDTLALFDALDIARVLQAGFGWLELGLPEEGLRELETLPAAVRETLPAALRLHACLLLTLGRFQEAAPVAWELFQREPADLEHALLAAHTFERSGNPLAALACLLRAEEFLRGSAEYHVQVARLQAALGELREAREQVALAIAADPVWRMRLLLESGLESLW